MRVYGAGTRKNVTGIVINGSTSIFIDYYVEVILDSPEEAIPEDRQGGGLLCDFFGFEGIQLDRSVRSTGWNSLI